MFLTNPNFEPIFDGEKVRRDGTSKLPLFRTSGNLEYVSERGEHLISLTPEDTTDLGTVPPEAMWLIHPHDERARRPFGQHDGLYEDQPVTRWRADALLFLSLREEGIPLCTAVLVWLAVRLRGGKFWARHAKK